jgi:hypothetical protein
VRVPSLKKINFSKLEKTGFENSGNFHPLNYFSIRLSHDPKPGKTNIVVEGHRAGEASTVRTERLARKSRRKKIEKIYSSSLFEAAVAGCALLQTGI